LVNRGGGRATQGKSGVVDLPIFQGKSVVGYRRQ